MRNVPHEYVRREHICSACPSKVPPGIDYCIKCVRAFPMLLKLATKRPVAAR